MNNKVSEEWFNKQKNKYLDSLAGTEFSKQYQENKEQILNKLKSELTLKYHCHSYDELEYIITQVKEDNYCKYAYGELKNITLYDKEFQKKFEFMKSVNLAKMRHKIFCGYQNRFLANEDSMKRFLEIYTLSDAIIHSDIDLDFYFEIELASYNGKKFTEDEKQVLNLYNSLYDTYLEYYQKFIDTLPESELKQELEAIPNEVINVERVTVEIERKTFGKKFLRRKKNK